MLQPMKSKQQDLLNTQENTDETPSKKSLLNEREKIENTPFWWVKSTVDNVEQHFITFGEYRVSNVHTTKKDALDELEKHKWDIIMHMTAVIVEKTLIEKKLGV